MISKVIIDCRFDISNVAKIEWDRTILRHAAPQLCFDFTPVHF